MQRCLRGNEMNVKAAGAILLTLLALMMSALIGAAPAGAAALSVFCSPRRTVESFGLGGGSGRRPVTRLVVAPGQVPAGHSPAIRVVNGGRKELSFGAEYTQRWVGGSWRQMPLPPLFVSGLALSFVAPESVSKCIGPLTLSKWPAGKYRWLLGVRAVGSNGFGRHRFLSAEFRLSHR
jgi:hypothetical protein